MLERFGAILGLPFITEVTYIERLQQLNLLPLSYWHEYLDLTFLFKVINRHVRVSEDAYPAREIYRKTRSSKDPSLITLKIPFARTVCYQSSYFIRASRAWNCLSKDLRSDTISFTNFKTGLLDYYITML